MVQNFKLIYSPEGGSRREWVIDLQNPAWDITFATEKATDWPWGVFVGRLQNSSGIAVRALLWVLRKRDEPRLSIESVKPNMDELDFAGQCPDCEEWVSTEDEDDHLCPDSEDAPATPSDGDEQPAGSEPGEA